MTMIMKMMKCRNLSFSPQLVMQLSCHMLLQSFHRYFSNFCRPIKKHVKCIDEHVSMLVLIITKLFCASEDRNKGMLPYVLLVLIGELWYFQHWLFMYKDDVVSWVKSLIEALQADAGLPRVRLTREQWHMSRIGVCLWFLELSGVAKHPASLTFCPLQFNFKNILKNNTVEWLCPVWNMKLLVHTFCFNINFSHVWSYLFQCFSSWMI